jgi:extradiol dioxygenase family protein
MSEKVHLALCVKDLQKSREFYESFFNSEPQREADDQIDWILDSPPVHFSIYVSENYPAGMEHMGFVFSPEKLATYKNEYKAEDGNIFDPDGNKIEVYTLTPSPQ